MWSTHRAHPVVQPYTAVATTTTLRHDTFVTFPPARARKRWCPNLRHIPEIRVELYCAPICANRCGSGFASDVYPGSAERPLVSN